jgi:CHAD domain-containing protein
VAKGVPLHKLTHPTKPLRFSAPVLLVRLNEMLEWATDIQDPARVSELHNMRISAKRLRYTMELFLPTLGQGGKGILKTVEEIQEQIGAIHDCDVLIPELQDTIEREMKRERKRALDSDGPPPFLAAEGLVALIHRKQEERDRRYQEFLIFWNNLPPTDFADRLTRLVLKAAQENTDSEDKLSDAL